MGFKYRDWPKRIHLPDTSYFITFYTKHRYPYFKESFLCDLFLENLKICKKLRGFLLFGWVIIYEHIHLLLMPTAKWNISEIMFSIKKQFSHEANRFLGYNNLPPITVSGQALVHLLGEDCYAFKYPKFRWQQSFYDRYIRNDTEFNNVLDYIAYNPEKHHLPDDWPYMYTNPKYEYLTDEI